MIKPYYHPDYKERRLFWESYAEKNVSPSEWITLPHNELYIDLSETLRGGLLKLSGEDPDNFKLLLTSLCASWARIPPGCLAQIKLSTGNAWLTVEKLSPGYQCKKWRSFLLNTESKLDFPVDDVFQKIKPTCVPVLSLSDMMTCHSAMNIVEDDKKVRIYFSTAQKTGISLLEFIGGFIQDPFTFKPDQYDLLTKPGLMVYDLEKSTIEELRQYFFVKPLKIGEAKLTIPGIPEELLEKVFQKPSDEPGKSSTTVIKDFENVWLETGFGKRPNLKRSLVSNGGDSISAVRLIGAFRSLGYKADLTTLMDAPSLGSWLERSEEDAFPQKNQAIDLNESVLSPMQVSLWAGYTKKGDSDRSFMEQFCYELEVCPSIQILTDSLNDLWKMYPQLRVVIEWDPQNNHYVQKVSSHNEFPADFRVLEKDVTPEMAIQNDMEEGFLSHLPLFRLSLISSEGSLYLLWTHHHVLMDGWSSSQLIKDFISLVEKRQASSIRSDDLFENFSPWINWNAYIAKSRGGNAGLDFSQLVEYEAADVTALGSILPESDYLEFHQTLDSHDFNVISNFAAENEFSISTVVSSALGVFLTRLTGETKLWFSQIFHGRENLGSEMETAVGLFIRNLPWLADTSMDNNFSEICFTSDKLFKKAVNSGLNNLDDAVVLSGSRPGVLLAFENYPSKMSESEVLNGKLHSVNENTGYPLSVFAFPTDDSLTLTLKTNGSSHSEAFTRAFLNGYIKLLRGLCTGNGAHKNVGYGLPWNKASLPTKFNWREKWFKSIRKKTVLYSDLQGSTLNGEEWVSVFNALKELLAKENIKPGSLLAVSPERTPFMFAVISSLVLSGYRYLPLHPGWPKGKIREIQKQSSFKAVIGEVSPELPKDVRFIYLDKNIFVKKYYSLHLDVEHYEQILDKEAYRLYTSGTTGEPKGICISDRNLNNFLFGMEAVLGNLDFNCFSASTVLSFDLSIFEIFYPVIHGCPAIILKDPSELNDFLKTHSKVLINTVPSVMMSIDKTLLHKAAIVCCAGEPFLSRLFSEIKEAAPEALIFNFYAPAESTTYSTVKQMITKQDACVVGKALPNESITIIDKQGHALPDGLPGEICIGGEGVALGYSKPEMNDNKFIFRDLRRYYLTGDKGFFNSKKECHLIGRIDDQIKLRGQRIELKEIENVVLENWSPKWGSVGGVCAGVTNKNNLFIALKKTSWEEQENKERSETLLNRLKLILPSYMIAQNISWMNKFPLTPNGKLNRKAIIQEINNAISPANDYQGDLPWPEKVSSFFFEEIGRLPDPSRGFFATGADSITAMRLISRLKKDGYACELKNLYVAESLEKWWKELSGFMELSEIETNEPQISGSNLSAMTPVQKWFMMSDYSDKNHYNQAVMIRLPESKYHLTEMKQAVEFMMHGFEIFNLCPGMVNGLPVWKKNTQNGDCEIVKWSQQTELSGNEPADHNQKKHQALNLEKGPLWAATLHCFESSVHLFIVVHHMVVDGVSWRIMTDRISEILNGEVPDPILMTGIGRQALRLRKFNSEEKAIKYGDMIFKKFTFPWIDREPGLYRDAYEVLMEWDEGITMPLFEKAAIENISTDAVLVPILMEALKDLFSFLPVLVLEKHGRSKEDFLEWVTPGWFTVFEPVDFSESPLDYDAAYNNLPVGFDLMTHCELTNKAFPTFPVLYNYLGNFESSEQGSFHTSNISAGNGIGASIHMLAFIEINGIRYGGKIQWTVRCSSCLGYDTAEKIKSSMITTVSKRLSSPFHTSTETALESQTGHTRSRNSEVLRAIGWEKDDINYLQRMLDDESF